MKKEKEKTGMNEFRAWLNTIPVGDYSTIKRQILEKCKTKDFIFRNWRYGLTQVPLLEQDVINKIAKNYNGTTCFYHF